MVDEVFHLSAGALEAMLARFREEFPREGCGFLAGHETIAHRFYPINNINNNRRRFLMDPMHIRRTELSILRRDQRLLGVCHSHPEGECYPSEWDIQAAFFDPLKRYPLWQDQVQLIALMEPLDDPVLGGFRILAGGVVQEVEIVVTDRESCSETKEHRR